MVIAFERETECNGFIMNKALICALRIEKKFLHDLFWYFLKSQKFQKGCVDILYPLCVSTTDVYYYMLECNLNLTTCK